MAQTKKAAPAKKTGMKKHTPAQQKKCDTRAANRKAQKKYQDKQPAGAQSKKVMASQKKTSTPNPSKKTPGAGKQGSKQGRPRKAC